MLLALSPTVVHSSTALQAQLQASVSGCSSVGIAMKCDYDLEFKSLLHAYGDVKEPSKACVGCVLGLVRKYVAEVITLASRRSVKRDNNLPLASEIAKASAEYSSRFMHFKLHSNSTDGWSAMQAVAAHEQTDKRLVERVGLIERRLAEGTEEQKAHLIACVGVSLVTHKRDRFRRFVGLKALAGKALELVGFIAQQRAAAIITEALRSQCSYDRYSSKAALEPLEFDEKLTLDDLLMGAAKSVPKTMPTGPHSSIRWCWFDDQTPPADATKKRKPPSEQQQQQPSGAAKKPKKKKAVVAEEEFCVCRSTSDFGFMIGCDGCDEWFHGKCVGMTKRHETTTWKCPFCTGKVPRPR
eukprot:TRINITY_DN5624_c0_g1_i3.p1 TRINITY_DN5624_c0_g1~~TRINITY_DN5624_c0_g1_i3.p1  ORF type:complete len:355 (+),score=103.23 TRINITY_DN5624_c0_g1_i3:276-1340(+)